MQRFFIQCRAGTLFGLLLALAPFAVLAQADGNSPADAGRSQLPASAKTQAQAYAKLPVCRLDPHDATRLAVEPCRTAPPRKPPRRAVAQQLLTMPEAPPLPQGGAAPLAAPAPGSALPWSGRPSSTPTAPIPVGTCGPGACLDVNGARYNGAGKVSVDQQGKTCTRNGAWLQCF